MQNLYTGIVVAWCETQDEALNEKKRRDERWAGVEDRLSPLVVVEDCSECAVCGRPFFSRFDFDAVTV